MKSVYHTLFKVRYMDIRYGKEYLFYFGFDGIEKLLIAVHHVQRRIMSTVIFDT